MISLQHVNTNNLISFLNLSYYCSNNITFCGDACSCNSKNQITEISLVNTGLSRTIPTAIGLLTSLTALHLSNTPITGTLPTKLGLLTSLVPLSGTIPTHFGRLTNLQTLDLSNNVLSGAVPTELSQLTNLQQANINVNQLSSPYTALVCQTPNLMNFFRVDSYYCLNNNNICNSGRFNCDVSNNSYLYELLLVTSGNYTYITWFAREFKILIFVL